LISFHPDGSENRTWLTRTDYYGILAERSKIVSNYGIARLQELDQELNYMMQEKEHIMFAMTCLKKYVDPIDQNSGKASVYSGEASV
jgi:hypothetical protein